MKNCVFQKTSLVCLSPCIKPLQDTEIYSEHVKLWAKNKARHTCCFNMIRQWCVWSVAPVGLTRPAKDISMTLKSTNCLCSLSLSLYPSFSLLEVNVERRLFIFRFGDPRARMNWVHVDNLVLAHTLAARALTPHRSYVSVSHAPMWLDWCQQIKTQQTIFVLHSW